MASIERFVFNHNFDEYKYQEGWNDQLYSELHINITNKKNELVEKARSLNNTYASHISNLRYEYKSNINNLEDDLERLRYED